MARHYWSTPGGTKGGMERDLDPPGDITGAGPRLTKIDGPSTRMELMFRRFKSHRTRDSSSKRYSPAV